SGIACKQDNLFKDNTNINAVQQTKPKTNTNTYNKHNVVVQAGSVAKGQTGYQERAEEWSGIAEVRTGGVGSESGSKQDQAGSRQDAGTGAHGKHTPRY
ncbi:unnamed protein product, partial [Staurois parvus]